MSISNERKPLQQDLAFINAVYKTTDLPKELINIVDEYWGEGRILHIMQLMRKREEDLRMQFQEYERDIKFFGTEFLPLDDMAYQFAKTNKISFDKAKYKIISDKYETPSERERREELEESIKKFPKESSIAYRRYNQIEHPSSGNFRCVLLIAFLALLVFGLKGKIEL